ncbi:MAG: RDD family protein [Saprospiraceae bacterium]
MENIHDYLQGNKIEQPVTYATFWQRFAAVLIDSVVLSFFHQIIAFVFGMQMYFHIDELEDFEPSFESFYPFFYYSASYIIINACYYILMESGVRQATVGKIALGLIVTDMNGQRISPTKALIRHFSKWISGAILLIGYIMQAFDPKGQALHDKIAETLVVRKAD